MGERFSINKTTLYFSLLYISSLPVWCQPQSLSFPRPQACGNPVDILNGQISYYNGDGTTIPCTDAKGKDGMQYECVEFVRRYYRIVKGCGASQACNTANWIGEPTGDAKSYFPNAAQFGLDSHKNKQDASIPQTGDIVTYAGNAFGHVAVVKNVVPWTQQNIWLVYVIEQNVVPDATALPLFLRKDSITGFYTLTDNTLIDNFPSLNLGYPPNWESRIGKHYSIQGWLHLAARFIFTSQNMGIARADDTATLLSNGEVLIAGGSSTGPVVLRNTLLYDPATEIFSPTGNLNTPRYDHTATLLPNGRVLIAGGFSNGEALASAELYDPSTGTFMPTAGTMKTAAAQGQTATLLPNGKVLIAGGFVGYANAQLYDPAMGSFSPTGGMIVGRFWHTATLLPNGKVLMTGGQGFLSGLTVASAELYDPATGRFSLAGSMTTARALHSATLLSNGEVLIAGGAISAGFFFYLSSAELYDPASGKFTATQNMVTARAQHVTATLQDGNVLLAGGDTFCGFNGSGCVVVTSTAERFDPVARVFTSSVNLNIARDRMTATALPSGAVLVAGGANLISFLNTAELYIP